MSILATTTRSLSSPLRSVELPGMVADVLESLARSRGLNLCQYLAQHAISTGLTPRAGELTGLLGLVEAQIVATDWSDEQIARSMEVTPAAVAAVREMMIGEGRDG